jgi:hypothetical protein
VTPEEIEHTKKVLVEHRLSKESAEEEEETLEPQVETA